jgi:L-seryl-tRNA(Ser) seleniumtransferase
MASGVDLACFSGDKLLGGPQAGLIVGRAELVGRLRKHPLYRALRLDKLSLAALEATLAMYREGRADEIPLRQMIEASPEECRERALRIARAIEGAVVEEGEGLPGGGALPGRALAGAVVAVRTRGLSALIQRLRSGDPSVLLRVSGDALIIDPRTVLVEQEGALIAALQAALAAAEPVG